MITKNNTKKREKAWKKVKLSTRGEGERRREEIEKIQLMVK
jgi:hypothetical protein